MSVVHEWDRLLTDPPPADWMLEGGKQDPQSITRDWQLINQTLIQGVEIREVKNVPTGYGWLTEIFRADWFDKPVTVDQVFQSILEPYTLSAWHGHAETTDRLFVNYGRIKIVLFDSRRDSPSYGSLNQFIFGSFKPALVIIPPKIWHGVQNISSQTSFLVNGVDQAYRY